MYIEWCTSLAYGYTYTLDMYRIAGKFGGELNLVAWRSTFATAKLKYASISYLHLDHSCNKYCNLIGQE